MLTTLLSRLPLAPALRKRWGLDDNELCFMQFARARRAQAPRPQAPAGRSVLVQMPNDYFYLCLFFTATQALGGTSNRLTGLWHQNIMSAPRGEGSQGLRRLLRRVFNALDRMKWQTLYASTGVQAFCSLEVGLVQAWKNWRQGQQIWRQLTSKDDLLALSLHGTPCGDLVYDTYLRYRVQATVDVRDTFLRTVIVQALNAQCAMRRLLKRGAFDTFLTSYSSYVQHGMPVREALRAGVAVYAAGNLSQYFKRLSMDDSLHAAAHWRYRAQFDVLADPQAAQTLAREQLENRFKGAIDRATLYMKTSAYGSGSGSMPPGVEGVVFLHDFFDSPHCYRNMLFPDFLEWARFTLQVVESEALPIAFKPHPNQLPESAVVVEALKREFPTVTWLDPKLSNHAIFQSGIRCGISVYGTILHELAYLGIPALSAGDHPHVAFDIATTPYSIAAYRKGLVDFRSIALPADVKTQVLNFYYMHNVFDKEDLPVDWGQMNMRALEQSDSVALPKFMAMYAAHGSRAP